MTGRRFIAVMKPWMMVSCRDDFSERGSATRSTLASPHGSDCLTVFLVSGCCGSQTRATSKGLSEESFDARPGPCDRPQIKRCQDADDHNDAQKLHQRHAAPPGKVFPPRMVNIMGAPGTT